MSAFRRATMGVLAALLAVMGDVGSALAGEPSSFELTLGEAVKTALEKHPALRAAEHAAVAAASGVDKARAGFFPRVDLSEGVIQSNNPVYVFGSLLNQGRFTAADFALDRLNNPDPITNWRTNLSGSVPLFLGGQDGPRVPTGATRAGCGGARSGSRRAGGHLRSDPRVFCGPPLP